MFIKNLVAIIIVLSLFISVTAQDDLKSEAERIYSEAETLRKTNKSESMREAIILYEKSLPLFNELNMRKREADVNNNIGYIYKRFGEFETSLDYFNRSLQINREIKNAKGEMIALLNMSQSLRPLGRSDEAFENVNKVLSISRQEGDKEREAAALSELGVFYYRNGKIQDSLNHFEKSALLFEELGKQVPQASLLNNIGLISRIFGYQEKALENYTKALEIFRSMKNSAGEADVSLNLSAVYKDLFRTAEAMEYFNIALNIFRQEGNRQREAVVLNNIGVFYNDLGDYAKARVHYNESANIAKEIGDKRQYSSTLKNLGILLTNIGESDNALEHLNKALEISVDIKDQQNEGWILNNIGFVYYEKKDYQQAEIYTRKSLEILRNVGYREGEARTLYILGLTLYHSGRKEEALKIFKESIEIQTDLQMPKEQAKTLLDIARVERDLGDISSSLETIEKASEISESMRLAIPGQNLRATFFSLGKDIYDFQINLLLNMNGKPSSETIAKAFEISEHTRARSLLETLAESKYKIHQGIDKDLLKQENLLRNRINARENYRMSLVRKKAEPNKLMPIEKEIQMLFAEYDQIRVKIRKQSPAYSELVQPQTLSLTDIQQSILDQNTVLLEYSLGSENSYLWLVTDNSIEHYRLPKREDIFHLGRKYKEALNARNQFVKDENDSQMQERIKNADRDLIETNQNLSQVLFPFDAEKLDNKRVLIVSEDILQYIPFSSLKLKNSKNENKEDYLITTNEIIHIPSASALAFLRSNKQMKKSDAEKTIAVFADPVFSKEDIRVKTALARNKKTLEKISPKNINFQASLLPSKLRSDLLRLKFSRLEANSISKFLPENRKFVALDFTANIKSLNSKKFSDADIIHFATHGIVMSEFPELSGIVLSLVDENGEFQNGYLRLHDIYNLKLNADLVVLSACDTALGKEILGEGIVGLTRGFMYAGTETVVASLWKVEDRATAELMKRFYRAMLKDGQKPAAALRTAQVEMSKDERWSNPYYWAAFTIQGEWK